MKENDPLPFRRVRHLLETAGGSRELPRKWFQSKAAPVALSAWWTLLLFLALAFVGRATRFIYVDF